jgi:sec-independent protein translocase protein TatB
MFDISWTEFLLIGVVALIVIGPKELPTVMRTMGQWARKIRVMAGDFQNQFHEAMREAEMADLKKQVDDIAENVKNYDPLKSARTEVEAIGKDLNAISPVEERPLPQIAAEPEQVAAEPQPEADHQATAGATTEPVAPEIVVEKASSDRAGRGE